MMKHKRKDMTLEDVIVHIRIEEKNRSREKVAEAKEFTLKANLIEERHDRPHGNHNRQNKRFGRRPTHGQRPKPNHLKPQASNTKKKVAPHPQGHPPPSLPLLRPPPPLHPRRVPPLPLPVLLQNPGRRCAKRHHRTPPPPHVAQPHRGPISVAGGGTSTPTPSLTSSAPFLTKTPTNPPQTTTTTTFLAFSVSFFDKPWHETTAFRSPSKALMAKIGQIECRLRLMVPALVTRYHNDQASLVEKLGAE
ncbi:hypothetical protein RJ639_019806 [Escallonia herrerae]|uniref:Uncharacterized protein n=1 Tax=Escallonia herrerae TaxID=1293975 RepID=A0AA89AJE2_9ASTE|nr:hypothetical protein RJ639_019806 [Escallonia herrerae]